MEIEVSQVLRAPPERALTLLQAVAEWPGRLPAWALQARVEEEKEGACWAEVAVVRGRLYPAASPQAPEDTLFIEFLAGPLAGGREAWRLIPGPEGSKLLFHAIYPIRGLRSLWKGPSLKRWLRRRVDAFRLAADSSGEAKK